MTSAGSKDWKGRDNTQSTSKTDAPTQSWRPRRGQTPPKPWLSRKRLLFGGLAALLILFVAIAIKLMRPDRVLRTHIVILTPLPKSTDFDSATTVSVSDDLEKSPFFSLRNATVFRSDEMRLADAKNQDSLDKAQVIVVMLQTSFFPVGDGKFLCIDAKTTPDIENSPGFDLSVLKSEFDKHQQKKLLLLVDSPPSGQDPRTGNLHADLVHEFTQWQKDLPSLVVVLSASESDCSEPGNPGTEGTSVFGSFFAAGLSSLADLNPDKRLTVDEFSDFMTKKTDNWIRSHRNPRWSGVVVLRNAAGKSSDRNFELVRDIQTVEGKIETLKLQPDEKDIQLTSEYWTRREKLRDLGAELWCPTMWVKCTDRLQRAERMLLHGRRDEVKMLLSEVKQHLDLLARMTTEFCTLKEDFDSDRGISRAMLQSLPSYPRCRNELFSNESENSETADTAADTVWEPENLLVQHIRNQFGKDRDVASVVDHVSTRRRQAEQMFAQVFDCFYVIPETLRRLDHDLLLDEDHQFVGSQSSPAASADLSERISALQLFAEAYGTGQTTLHRALNELPTLIGWASEIAPEDDGAESLADSWRKVLLKSVNTDRVTLKDVDEISEPVGMPAEATGLADLEYRLRKAVLKFSLATLGLQQTLRFRESGTALSAAEIREITIEMESWRTKTHEMSENCETLSEKLMATASGAAGWPMDSTERIRRARLLRRSLILTTVPEKEVRSEALKRIISVESQDSGDEKVGNSKDDSGESPNISASRPLSMSKVVAALWQVHLLKFIPDRGEGNDDSALVRLSQQLSGLSTANPDEVHEVLAAFGKTVRTSWKANREAVMVAARNKAPDALNRLVLADQQSRLFTGFDAQQMTEPLQERLFQLRQIEYALMQAQRHILSQWIAPGENASLWYQSSAEQWMTVVKNAEQKLTKAAIEIPESVTKQMSKLNEQIDSSNAPRLVADETQRGDLDLSEVEPAHASKEFVLKTIQLLDGVDGEATFRVFVSGGADNQVTLKDANLGWHLKAEEPQVKTVEVTRIGDPRRYKDQADVQLISEVFFRGWKFSGQAIGVALTGPPEYTTRILPPEQKAIITVDGDDQRPVVLILDFSGSMAYDNRKLPDGSFRYETAIEVLQELADSPLLDRAQVALNVFGHRYSANGKNPAYERIFNVKLQNENANKDISEEFKERLSTPDSKQRLKDRLKMLRLSKPFGVTPLFRALHDALLGLKGESGIIIALTDGEPTDDGRKNEDAPSGSKAEDDFTPQLRKAIDENPDATIRLVAFDVFRDANVLTALNETFSQFKDKSGRNRILISDASDEESLKTELEASLDPREFEVLWGEGDAGNLRAQLGKSVELPLAGHADEPKVAVKFGTRAAIADITVAPGDHIRLEFNQNFNGFSARRERGGKSLDVEGLLLRSDENAKDNDAATNLSQVTPISRDPDDTRFTLMLDHDDRNRPVQQPEEIEFFVRSSIAPFESPMSLTQVFDSGRGAPAWTFTAQEWPPDSNFLVDAHWKQTRTIPGEVFNWSDLARNHATRDTAMSVDSVFLPKCTISVRVREQDFEVRLDPHQDAPGNAVDPSLHEIRIELGDGSLLERKDKFKPWKHLPVTKVRMGRSLVCSFPRSGVPDDDIAKMQVALTSATSRKEGASSVKEFRVD